MEASPTPVPWPQIATFVRQLSHDLRNDLNSLSLEAALIKELVADPEVATSASRIQVQLREIANRLKDLSTRLVLPAPQPTNVPLDELAKHLQNAVDSKTIEWKTADSTLEVRTDPVLLSRAFRELAANALEHAPNGTRPMAELAVGAQGGGMLILQEAGSSLYPWPETPFSATRSGHYGVGIYLASAIFRGLDAPVKREAKDGTLETRITLPAA
jgi:light-regulated signal transduction histidine kinase (bacteriophytochrome)